MEVVQAYNIVQEVKSKTGFDKIVVIQPFGRSVQNVGEFIVDSSSRSFNLINTVEIINNLKKEYGVILMSEFPIALEEKETGKNPVAMLQINDLRIWAGIIDIADHFVGCDSLGQHLARAFNKTATIVTGSTFPINISYPTCPEFDIIDVGKDTRVYSPIRISMEDELDRANDEVMELSKAQVQQVLVSIKKRLGKSTKFTGKFIAPQQQENACCSTSSPAQVQPPAFSSNNGSLKPLSISYTDGDKH
jgi:ADP-heptose:LPS heptosyltransferase